MYKTGRDLVFVDFLRRDYLCGRYREQTYGCDEHYGDQ